MDLSKFPETKNQPSKRNEDYEAENIVSELESGTLNCGDDKFCAILQKNYDEPVDVECVAKDKCKFSDFPIFSNVKFLFSLARPLVNGGPRHLTPRQRRCRRRLPLPNGKTRNASKVLKSDRASEQNRY